MMFQDFPEYFEDNLPQWMDILIKSLNIPGEITQSLLKLEKRALTLLNLCCSNYSEDIKDYQGNFFPVVCELVQRVKHEEPYSKVIRELLDYFKFIFRYNRGIDENFVQQLVNNLILPEMKLTGKEIEDFNDNPVNFLKIELEEADMDSNKYHAINLLKNLIIHYPNLLNNYITPLIYSYLDNYAKNPKNWMDKIVAINLIFATMIKTFAQRIGATEVKVSNEEISNMIQIVFLKEFQNTEKTNILAKVYSIKFLSTFRLQIPHDWHSSIILMLVNIMNSSDVIMQSGCLLALEKILFMKDLNSNLSLAKDAVNDQNVFMELVGGLVKILSVQINIFAMRCFFKTLFLTQESYLEPVLSSLSQTINDMIRMVIADPKEDQFNYYLFETITMLLKKLYDHNPSLYYIFESEINQNLIYIVQNGINDLLGVVFQTFSLQLSFIDMTKNQIQGTIHENIISSVLDSEIWILTNKYLFKPFLAYLRVMLIKSSSYFLSDINRLTKLFAIMTSLLNLKNYLLAFELAEYLICFLNSEYIKDQIYGMIYNLLIIHKSLKEGSNKKGCMEFSKLLLIFISKLIIKNGSKLLVDILEQITPGLTVQLIIELSEFMIDLDEVKNKKYVNYAYCLLINDYYSVFDINMLRLLTEKLIKHLERFNKSKLNFFGDIDKVFGQCAYEENSCNKLYNAEIKVSNVIL